MIARLGDGKNLGARDGVVLALTIPIDGLLDLPGAAEVTRRCLLLRITATTTTAACRHQQEQCTDHNRYNETFRRDVHVDLHRNDRREFNPFGLKGTHNGLSFDIPIN